MPEQCLHSSGGWFRHSEPEQCGNDALPGSDYCAAHADEELTFDQIIREGKEMDDND